MRGLEPPAKTFQAGDTALVIGAGLAGCAVAGALSQQGFQCHVFDSGLTAASETSAVPVAIYRPYLSLGQSAVNQYYSNAFARIVDELKTLDLCTFQQNGLLQLVTDQRSWPDGEHHRILSRKEVSDALNRNIAHPAIYIENAGSLIPSRLCHHWLRNTQKIKLTTSTTVQSINKSNDGWELRDTANTMVGKGHFVVLANGLKANTLAQQQPLPLTAISGQISHITTETRPALSTPIIEHRGYAVPSIGGYWVGATHHRHCLNKASSPTDDESNLAMLKILANTTGRVTRSWTGVRCATPDRLPAVGGIADSSFFSTAYRELHHGRKFQTFPPARHIEGLYIAAGMGSRGATQALYAAELLVDIIKGDFKAEPTTYSAVNPARFLIKQLRRKPIERVSVKK